MEYCCGRCFTLDVECQNVSGKMTAKFFFGKLNVQCTLYSVHTTVDVDMQAKAYCLDPNRKTK